MAICSLGQQAFPVQGCPCPHLPPMGRAEHCRVTPLSSESHSQGLPDGVLIPGVQSPRAISPVCSQADTSRHLSSALSCWVCLGPGVFALSVPFQACCPHHHAPFLVGTDGLPRSHSLLSPPPSTVIRGSETVTECPISVTQPSHVILGNCLPSHPAKLVPLPSSTTGQRPGRGATLAQGHPARDGPAGAEDRMSPSPRTLTDMWPGVRVARGGGILPSRLEPVRYPPLDI